MHPNTWEGRNALHHNVTEGNTKLHMCKED